jgi:hypothetical protein
MKVGDVQATGHLTAPHHFALDVTRPATLLLFADNPAAD